MRRPITGFGLDEEDDPFAWLSCGHRQHVRHRPPFTNRPWVTSEAGRESKLGETLDCVRCDRLEMPDGFEPYRRTPDFDQDTVPAGLVRDHATREGVWGRIVVTHGALRYVIDGFAQPFELVPGTPGIVPAEVAHRVEVAGAVRFHVEFWRGSAATVRN